MIPEDNNYWPTFGEPQLKDPSDSNIAVGEVNKWMLDMRSNSELMNKLLIELVNIAKHQVQILNNLENQLAKVTARLDCIEANTHSCDHWLHDAKENLDDIKKCVDEMR